MVRPDLLREALLDYMPVPKPLHLHKKWIDLLLHDYYCAEMSENYYDSEPELPEPFLTIYNKHIDDSGFNMDAAVWENPDFHKAWEHACKMYEPRRLTFCNWIEPHFEGNWDVTQKQVDKYAYDCLMGYRNRAVPKANRVWIDCSTPNVIRIYCYGRDWPHQHDLYFYFVKRGTKKPSECLTFL